MKKHGLRAGQTSTMIGMKLLLLLTVVAADTTAEADTTSDAATPTKTSDDFKCLVYSCEGNKKCNEVETVCPGTTTCAKTVTTFDIMGIKSTTKAGSCGNMIAESAAGGKDSCKNNEGGTGGVKGGMETCSCNTALCNPASKMTGVIGLAVAAFAALL